MIKNITLSGTGEKRKKGEIFENIHKIESKGSCHMRIVTSPHPIPLSPPMPLLSEGLPPARAGGSEQ